MSKVVRRSCGARTQRKLQIKFGLVKETLETVIEKRGNVRQRLLDKFNEKR